MTARASTPEFVCSHCRSLVLRACGGADLVGRPSCLDCGRVVCDACQLGGLCAPCFGRVYSAPLEVDDDDHETLVVVEGVSTIGTRPALHAQPPRVSDENHAR